jgi:hypothetical protein
MIKMLKTYMVFSNSMGSADGAGLVFAHSHKEARIVGWRYFRMIFLYEYIDTAANLIKKAPWLYESGSKELLEKDIPHGVWDIPVCKQCELWGDEIGPDELCSDCRIENIRNEFDNSNIPAGII